MDRFTIAIDQFEGPLDLMLHLIKEHELDLFDLDLSLLADQYIAYIEAMEDMHLEVASEYLSELAGLLEYKSKRLLPKEPSELDDHYEEDVKEQMVQRLLEYDRFKKVSQVFEQRYQERSQCLDKPQETIVGQWMQSAKEQTEDMHGNPYDLIRAMQRMLRRYQILKPMPVKVARKEFSIEDRNAEILIRLKTMKETFTLEELCEDCQTQDRMIVTFLSVLDLIHTGILVATTDGEETIWLKRGNGYAESDATDH